MSDFIKPEDYTEAACPLCDPNKIKRIDTRRMTEKEDEYLSRNDYPGAERHLKYWLAEAMHYGDGRGMLAVQNELMGLFRKTDRRAEALEAAQAALALIQTEGMENTLTAGTTFLNAATVYKAFDMAEKAMPLYRRAQALYEESLDPRDDRLAGLYNNMGLALTDLGEYREAEEAFHKAMEIMHKNGGNLEEAITCLNWASAVEAEKGLEAGSDAIGDLTRKAMELIESSRAPQNGYYAFVCEKCAPVFGYYGYFRYEKELSERARKIYERA